MSDIHRRDHLFSPTSARIIAYIGRKNEEGEYPTVAEIEADILVTYRSVMLLYIHERSSDGGTYASEAYKHKTP